MCLRNNRIFRLNAFKENSFHSFPFNIRITWAPPNLKMSQRMIKPTIRRVRPLTTHISLRIRAVGSVSSLIECAFYSLKAIQIGMNKNSYHTGWMYRLIWVFADHIGLIVGCHALAYFVCCWARGIIKKPNLVATLKKFYGRHHDLVNPYNVAVSRIVSDVFANDAP